MDGVSSVNPLLIEQRLALWVSTLSSWGSEKDVSATVLAGGDPGRANEENSKDHKTKNPLEGDDLDEELFNGQGYREYSC